MLVLVRHGQSEGNAAGLLLGRIDSPLTDAGTRQARRLGAVLARMLGPGGVRQVVTSPLERARHTALALGVAADVPVEVDDRWVEVDYGAFDGQPLTDVPADVWVRWRTEPSFRPPGGETLTEMGDRVRAACEELFAADGAGARHADGHVVVVSHVSPVKAAVGWALGAADSLAWRLYLATGSVTVIGWGTGGPVLRAFNLAEAPVGR